jgi:transglutaminase-like putative cysteine protease/tetratricopeptide (TPR) repeat protein
MIPFRRFSACTPGVVVLVLLLARNSSATVESPWNLPALTAKPEDILRAAAASPAPKDGDIEMLFEEHIYKLDEQGRQQRISRRVYRFLTDKGVDDWSCTEADWSPWCEEKPVFRVRVITPDGQAHALDQESIGEAAAEQDTPNLFSDAKLLRGPLPAIVVGAVVEEEVETREIRSLFEHGIVERFLLSQQYPVRQLRLVIDTPDSLPLKYEVSASDAKPTRLQDKGRTTLVFDLGPLPATDPPEDYLPAENAKTPQVVFSTGKSWIDVAAAYAELVESHLDIEAVRAMAQKAVGAETNREKIIERLLAALRGQIRYTGVEFGKGAIVPRSSRETLARRYGDCKDQATLLVAMLRVAGIRAEVALLRTGRYGDVAPALPGLGDFDHAIVFVPGPRPLWIDPSARCAAVGYLPLVDQDRWAMLASPATRELARTAKMDYTANTGEQVFDLFPLEYGKGRVRVTVTCGGSCEEDLREDYASLGIKALRKHWKEYLKDQFRTQTSPRLEFTSPLDLTKPFRVTAEVPDARIGQFDEAAATITLQPDSLFERLPGLFRGVEAGEERSSADHAGGAPPDERKGPMLLPEPHIRQLQYRINLPAGFTPKSLPASSVKRHGPATISQKYEISGDNLIVATFRLDTGPGLFTAEEVEDLRQAIAELAKDENSPWEVKIRLENVAASLIAAGRATEALSHARAELARYADRADQHSHYSRLLLKAGLGEAARAEARRAVELEPRSAAAYANLARTLTYDLLGRHFQPGIDWAGAAEAYSKALELDPSDIAMRMDYAILLEHDEDGLRYAPGTRLDEAVEEYRKAQRQLGPRNRLDSLEANLALALLFSERYAELEKLAARAEKSAAWRGFLVAAVAARQGVLEADRKATEVSADADTRREIVQNAAEYLQQVRLYNQAAVLYEAAAQGAVKADELKAKAKVFAGMRRMGEMEPVPDTAPASGARRVVQQLFAAALSGSKARARIPTLFVSTASTADVAGALPVLYQAVRPALETARENQVPPLRIVDGILQQKFTVEGDAVKGFLVRVSGEQLNDSVWRVALERGEARILGPAALLAAMGTVSDQLNNRAWAAVVADKVDRQALEDALSAVKETNRENASCLHTLAAVYAELGKTPEALENLRRAVEIRGQRMAEEDWYVLGRIAEDYGLNEVAAGLYRKAPAKQLPTAYGIYALAQRRLKKMGK